MKTYTGGCHCKSVQYSVETALESVISCNCSRCNKLGLQLSFVPATQFKLLSGEARLKDYLFNKRQIHHLFCIDCGVESFARGTGPDGSEMVAINVRCLDGVDSDKLELTKYNGKDK